MSVTAVVRSPCLYHPEEGEDLNFQSLADQSKKAEEVQQLYWTDGPIFIICSGYSVFLNFPGFQPNWKSMLKYQSVVLSSVATWGLWHNFSMVIYFCRALKIQISVNEEVISSDWSLAVFSRLGRHFWSLPSVTSARSSCSMAFGVRRVATNSTSTAAPRCQPCVWTGATSGSSCKDCSFFMAPALVGDSGFGALITGLLLACWEGSPCDQCAELWIELVKQPAMSVCSQGRRPCTSTASCSCSGF